MPKHKWSQKATKGFGDNVLSLELAGIKNLIDKEEWDKALSRLLKLNQKFPEQPEVLETLIDLYEITEDLEGALTTAERLIKITPNAKKALLRLASLYFGNYFPALARETFCKFLEQFPEDDSASYIHEALEEIPTFLEDKYPDLPADHPQRDEIFLLWDRSLRAIELGRYQEAHQQAQAALSLAPGSVQGLNVLGEIFWEEGNKQEALKVLESAFASNPQHLQTIAGLSRYSFWLGQAEEAKVWAQKLQGIGTDSSEKWVKVAEILSLLGDDAGVLSILDQCEPESNQFASFYHLIAVAQMRSGHRLQAIRFWEKALALNPDFSSAQVNLRDLEQPVDLRNGPWSFDLYEWLPKSIFSTLSEAIITLKPKADENHLNADVVRDCLANHPEIYFLFSQILDRGGPNGRRFVLAVTDVSRDPELLKLTRDFAFTQNGLDSLRYQGALLATRAGLLEPGEHQMWLGGQWRKAILLGTKINYTRTDPDRAPKVSRLFERAIDHLNQKEYKQAEQILKQALVLEPTGKDLKHNLAISYIMQKREDEGQAIFEQLYRDHPDYPFAPIGLAQLSLQKDRIEEAEAFLSVFWTWPSLHAVVFSSVCETYIKLSLAHNDLEKARNWFYLWQQVTPGNPDIEPWRTALYGSPSS